jgi:hypothetical protein
MLRLVKSLSAAGGVPTGEGSGTQSVSDHTEKHGETDRTDHLVDRAGYIVQVLESDQGEHDRGEPSRAEPPDEEHGGSVHS